MGKCGTCKKQLVEQTIATKTKKVGGNLIVVEQTQALVCPDHGVVVWEPVRALAPAVPIHVPYVQNPFPAPFPARPGVRPWPQWPTVTYSGKTNATNVVVQ